MRILVSGGGTGGHVYPILSVASALRQTGTQPGTHDGSAAQGTHPAGMTGVPGGSSELRAAAVDLAAGGGPVELRYVGEAGGMEEGLAKRAAIPFSPITSGQIRGRAPWVVARNLARMRQGARQCAEIMREFRPDAVFVTGGYVTAPVAWAAARHPRPQGRGIPLLIYLPDLTPGLAIRLTSRLAARVAVSFPEVAGYFGSKAVVTGYPVRPELLQATKGAARAALGLREDVPVLFVLGGSRGARSINRALTSSLPTLLPRCQVVHVSGQLDWPWVADVSRGEGAAALPWDRYHAYPYLHEEMIQALAAADLVVARAGAATLGEFPAVGLPSILVPYPYAGQHQHANADYLAQRGAALILEDGELPGRLAATVCELFDSSARLAAMADSATALARPDAARNIAEVLRELTCRS